MRFSLNESTRVLMAREHRAVQVAISAIANQKFGNPHPPTGIGVYQGGVLVNGRQITLRDHWATDEAIRRPVCDSPEEIATVAAIEEVANIVENEGLSAIKTYDNPQYRMKDPLRSMLNLTREQLEAEMISRPEWNRVLPP